MSVQDRVEQMISDRIEQLLSERPEDMTDREKETFDMSEKLQKVTNGEIQQAILCQTDRFTDCLTENNRYLYRAGIDDGIRIAKIILKI